MAFLLLLMLAACVSYGMANLFGITGQSSSTNSQTTINNDNRTDASQTDNKVNADGGASVITSGGGNVSFNGVPENLEFAGRIVDTAFNAIKGGGGTSGGSSGSGGGSPSFVLPGSPAASGSLPSWGLPAIGIGLIALVGGFLLLRKK